VSTIDEFRISLKLNYMPPNLLQIMSQKSRASTVLQSLIGACDQGAVALGSLIPIMILGRFSGSAELGIFSLSVSVVLFFTLAQDALILSSYPVLRAQFPSLSKIYTFYVLLYATVPQCVLLLVYLPLGYWCVNKHENGSVCSVIGLIPYLPPIILRHFLRQLSLSRNNLLSIFLLDFALLLLQSAALLLLAEFGTVNAQKVCSVLAATSIFFVVVWLSHYGNEIKVQFSELTRHLAQCTAFGWWALASVLSGTLPNYVIPWLLVVLYGPEETAVFAAASTVVGLINHAFLGLTKGLAVRTASAYQRGGIHDLDQSVKQACRIVFPALAAIIVAIFLVAQPLSELILPGREAHVANIVRLLSIATLIGGLHIITGTGLWAMGRPQMTFLGDLIRGMVGIALGALIGMYFGAMGCAVALMLGNAAGSLILITKYRALLTSRTQT
jgi:O-antigen/teichoic acid export membrane protein